MARKLYDGVWYDTERDHQKEIDDAVASGDFVRAGMLEQQRNAKIKGEGLNYKETSNYAHFLKTPGETSETVSSNGTAPEVNTYGITPDDDWDDEPAVKAPKNTGFRYDSSKDKTYNDLVRQTKKNAEIIGKNVLGNYSTLTGGMPSSFAVSAAAGAEADVLDDINDLYAEREAAAYGRWVDDYNRKKAEEATDYARMIDKKSAEAAEAEAAENKRRWDLEYGLKEDESAANIDAIKADTDLTKANTEGILTENEYIRDEKQAELDAIKADTDLTKANTAGILAENEYIPLEKQAEIDNINADTYKIYNGLDGEGDAPVISSALDIGEAGTSLSQANARAIEQLKNSGLYKINAGELPTADEQRALILWGYTAQEINAAIQGFGTKTETDDGTRKTYLADKPANPTNIGVFTRPEMIAAQGEDGFNIYLTDLLESGQINEAELAAMYEEYAEKYGWE